MATYCRVFLRLAVLIGTVLIATSLMAKLPTLTKTQLLITKFAQQGAREPRLIRYAAATLAHEQTGLIMGDIGWNKAYQTMYNYIILKSKIQHEKILIRAALSTSQKTAIIAKAYDTNDYPNWKLKNVRNMVVRAELSDKKEEQKMAALIFKATKIKPTNGLYYAVRMAFEIEGCYHAKVLPSKKIIEDNKRLREDRKAHSAVPLLVSGWGCHLIYEEMPLDLPKKHSS